MPWWHPSGVSRLRSSSGRRPKAPAIRACVQVPVRAWVRVCLGLCQDSFVGARVLMCSYERVRLCLHMCMRACLYA